MTKREVVIFFAGFEALHTLSQLALSVSGQLPVRVFGFNVTIGLDAWAITTGPGRLRPDPDRSVSRAPPSDTVPRVRQWSLLTAIACVEHTLALIGRPTSTCALHSASRPPSAPDLTLLED